MPSTVPTKPAGVSTTSHVAREESKKHLDHEIRNMITALTNRLAQLHSLTKLSGRRTAHDGSDDDPGALGAVTLAGTNHGATMRSGFEEMDPASSEGREKGGAYVNSNFQAVNNSVLLGGSYIAEDPGVHMVIEEYGDKKKKEKEKEKKKKEKEKKKKEKEKGVSRNDKESEKRSEAGDA